MAYLPHRGISNLPIHPATSNIAFLQAGDTGVSTPLVSIGLPVYNGERYLRAALDSLIGQDYPNLELILSDNASTDATAAICREYATRDPRIRYYRLHHNIGAVTNFKRVAQLARGTYFKWAAFDDLRSPTYLSACVAALQADLRAVLCCTGLRLIDEDGQEVDEATWTHGIRPVGRTPWQRIRAVAQASYWYDIYGLMRRTALQQTRGLLPIWGSDVVLLLELCLRGRVLYVPEKLFTYRVFPHKKREDLAHVLEGTQATATVPVSWSTMILAMSRGILRAPLPGATKLGLTLRFVWEISGRNQLIGNFLYEERFAAARRAFGGRAYRHSLALFMIVALGSSQYLRRRIATKLRKELRIR